MDFYWLLLATLSAWRITHLLQAEDGPWELMARLRRRAGASFWGELLDCFYCLSLWIAAPLAFVIGENWRERLLLWPALSAGAILLERISRREASAPPAIYFEDKENEHVLLRQKERTDQTPAANSSQ
ncbi:DUF1360 domain-containing protein [candidate division KSB1 bacterium]|nr:DUF1360 domain-containing protein [candidate division KSB1 bacterium]